MTPSETATPTRPRRFRLRWIILSVLLLGIVGAGAAILWHNRPIEAVVLTAPEEKVLAEKIALAERGRAEPTYQAGEKTISLTERELNGLLNKNTAFGDQLKLVLATDAVHARLEADIPEESPFMAGKKLKGRARFLTKTENGVPSLVLDDVTVWGISVPNAWLGNAKGQNLLSSLFPSGISTSSGFESIRVKNGSLEIQLAE